MRALEGDEAGEHAPLGGAQGGQARLAHAEQGEVLRELAVEEGRGLVTFGGDHAERGQGGRTVQGVGGSVLGHAR